MISASVKSKNSENSRFRFESRPPFCLQSFTNKSATRVRQNPGGELAFFLLELVDEDRLVLADAIIAIGGVILEGWPMR